MDMTAADRVVLVIDDDDAAADAVIAAVDQAGWRCLRYSGEHTARAIAAAIETAEGAVVLDYHLGAGVKAPDVLALLDEGDRGRVVIVTSDHSPAVAAKARELGVVRLLKPLKAEQARQVLGRLLG